ncbi:NAD(P)H-hydrate dehydratase [candidate division KSB1 bacterium]|nr:NAD(P)H-hydrate dehydratase [candidate division KSB1 bacterium]RQW09994.1 MAG: NAD(P)H-hydrate dehydratase [candidate division KSB1 bacterium]
MNPVVTASEMAAMDRCAMHELQMPGLLLMENAGRGIFNVAAEMLNSPSGKIVHIYCGPGNNGGDGYVAARHLLNNGAIVRTMILSTAVKIKGDARVNLDILQQMGHQPEFISMIPSSLDKPDLIVDALLGTGVKGPLHGTYAAIVNMINKTNCPVLAIDIPTGVNADTGQIDGPAIRATVTATMALPKRGLLLSPGREHTGRLEIIDIGMPREVLRRQELRVHHVDKNYIQNILPRRSPDAHKNKVGMIHVIAGSKGFTGAAALASRAVLRAGAGLCYLTIPESLHAILAALNAEVITRPVQDAGNGFLVSDNYECIKRDLENKTALVLGPGIGLAAETREVVHQLLAAIALPLVLDADGLNACVDDVDLLRRYNGDLVITPHPGEMARLTGLSTSEIVTNRIDIARQFAETWRCSVVLKGGPTVTASPDGHVYVNSSGNAGMATAGAGDVLSGTIAAFIGQGLSSEKAAIAAVFIHGYAGDLAAARYGQMGMVAGDIVEMMPHALKKMEAD